MNDYLIFVNGNLAPASHGFGIATATNENGRYLRLTINGLEPKRLDVLEVRASNIVRRYQWLPDDKKPVVNGVYDCVGVGNAF